MRLSSCCRMIGILVWFKFKYFTMIRMVLVIVRFFFWLRDLERERRFLGNHTFLVLGGLKWGLAWFLFREVWFFFRVFWAFFHASTAPLSRGNWCWPGEGLFVIPPFQVPLLNTVILLVRGVTATLAHHKLLAGRPGAWLNWTVALGAYFLILQGVEYKNASYRISSGIYGRVFFFGTGFHGIHVCLGAIMLLVNSLRLQGNLLTATHHFGLEFGLWYWHFVDVVWLFLFFWVYVWGSYFILNFRKCSISAFGARQCSLLNLNRAEGFEVVPKSNGTHKNFFLGSTSTSCWWPETFP